MTEKKFLSLVFLFIGLNICGFAGMSHTSKAPIDYVDPFIGTTKAGNTFPAVGVPFGMTQWTPQTVTPKLSPPYRYYDPDIQGFRGSHWLSGSATQDYGSMTVMPITGVLKVRPQARSSSFSHTHETAEPDYYKVNLLDYNIIAELTGTTRCGLMRFTFPKSDSSYIIIDSNAAYQATRDKSPGAGYIKIDPADNEIVGYNPVYRKYQGWGTYDGIKGYFVVHFNKPIEKYGTWNHGQKPKFGSKIAGDRPGAFVRFRTKAGEKIEVKIGTSFTSIAEARKNLGKEIPDWNFDRIRNQSRRKWNENLSRIKVEGGSRAERINFYTSLYHALLLPRVFNDDDGSYVGFAGDSTIHKAIGYQQYADYSLWDTFRAVHPLFTIIEPKRANDMVVSLIKKGEQGGFLPIFPAWDNYTSEMIGDHAVSVIVDAYEKGIRNFNVQKAYQLIRQNAMRDPDNEKDYADGKGRRALNIYKRLGYIPLEDSVKEAFHQGEQVSRTLEYAYDDWAAAQLAKALGKKDDYEILMKRAHNYKNVFDTTVGFVRGRYEDGTWAAPFDSVGFYHYITEGTPYQYSWFVPQDVQGLINLMGGREKFVSKLEAFFEDASELQPAFRRNPYYWHGNEPGHHTVYLFCYAGAPWRTQKWVREIINRSYQASPGGLSGNDDAGQMSAWYIFSTMGFYPVCPGRPSYEIGSPVFDKVTINVGKGKYFTIKTIHNSRRNKYIQSALLNGKKWDKPWITQAVIESGGTLTFTMGPVPNKAWGTSPSAAPPSMSK